MKDYLALTKPRITWLILMSTAIGCFFGLHGAFDVWLLLNTLAGTALLASGTATLNQWSERAADALMRRTESRPIPAGRVSARHAFLFGLALLVAGELELAAAVNALSAWLGFAAVRGTLNFEAWILFAIIFLWQFPHF